MVAQRLVRCDQGHVFDAGASAACPTCGWPVPERGEGLAPGATNDDARSKRTRHTLPMAAGAAVLLIAGVGTLWLMPDSNGNADAERVAEGPAQNPPQAVREPETAAGGRAAAPGADVGESADPRLEPGDNQDAAGTKTQQPEVTGAVPDGNPPEQPAQDTGADVPGNEIPAQVVADENLPKLPTEPDRDEGSGTLGDTPAAISADPAEDQQSGGTEAASLPETVAPDQGASETADRIAGIGREPIPVDTAAETGATADTPSELTDPGHAATPVAGPTGLGAADGSTSKADVAAGPSETPAGGTSGYPVEDAAPPPDRTSPAADVETDTGIADRPSEPGQGGSDPASETTDAGDSEDVALLLSDRPTPVVVPPAPGPGATSQPEPGLATLLAVAPEQLTAARRALAAPPQGKLTDELGALSPHAAAEEALGLSHALRHALALARAERAAAQGETARARALFAGLAADNTVAAGARNPRALFGHGFMLWNSGEDTGRVEGARLLRAAAEQGGLTGAIDLLLSDQALFDASAITPDALRPVLEAAYLQNPSRFAAQLAARGIDTKALGSAATALREAARKGDTRAFSRAHAAVGAPHAPVIESLLAVTLEGDAKLRPTPRAAERQLIAALISGLAGVTNGRVALAMIAERGQADLPGHLPDAALWLVLALSDVAQGHPQRAGIEALLRTWAARLPPEEAGQVARIAGEFGVR